ncbi:MAG TPA: hypothetical protein VFZ22_19135 [Pyrinomonadaceae bacterium]|nr:hypothetical protein [Pyrinomonadaceae bacterium]
MPVLLRMYVNGDVDFALDGASTEFTRPLVEYGEHVLSFVVSGFDRKAGILMFAASVETNSKASPVSRREFVSEADGSWKYTLDAPSSASWMSAGFDDSDWRTLVVKPVPQPDKSSARWFWHKQLVELGANGLGINENWTTRLFGRAPSSDRIWIRKVFNLTPEAAS